MQQPEDSQQSPPDMNFSFGLTEQRLETPLVSENPSQEPSLVAVDAKATAQQPQEQARNVQEGAHQEAWLNQAAEPSATFQQKLSPTTSHDASLASAGDSGAVPGTVPEPSAVAGDSSTAQPEAAAAAAADAKTHEPLDAMVQHHKEEQQQQQQQEQQQQERPVAGNANLHMQHTAGRLAATEAMAIGPAPAPAAAAAPAPAAASSEAQASTRPQDNSYFVGGMRAIDVEVDAGPGAPCRLLHVTIDVSGLQEVPKPFIGGFRHKQSGVVYHHASSQTPKVPPKRMPGAAAAAGTADAAVSSDAAVASVPAEAARVKLSRVTQTVDQSNTSCQTVREAATQMARPGLQLDCSEDRIITPRPYISSEVVGQRRAAAALTIQRHCRGWLARLRAAALRAIKAERDGFLAAAAAERQASAQAERRREVERRTHPLVRSDFELLSSELEAWRQQQTSAIKAAGLEPLEEQAALKLLLAKETRLLQTLDRLRVNAKQESQARHTQQQLGSLSQPKTWVVSNGKKVLMHTPQTVRAAELQQLHRGLVLPGLSLDERLDVLLHVKWAVKEFDCRLTRELVELIDREADLLNRGRSLSTLDGLRRRIAGAFLSFCRNPSFNPEAARLQLVPGSSSGPEVFQYVEDWREGDGA